MYCLEKFQRELAYFLDIDLRDLPKVQEILKAQGYTAVKKNDEIIELGNGKISKEQVEKLKEVVESGDKVEKVENIHNLRDELTTALTPILNKDITNISSGITAQVSKTSIKKMGSDKAINKSIENGFSLQEHFKASADIENLYKKATNIATTKDLKNGDPAIQMHTFISQVNDNANAKILVKESLDKDSRRIYTLELESLESTKPLAQVPNGDLADHLSKSKQKSDTSLTPLENVKEHSTTNKIFNQGEGESYKTITQQEALDLLETLPTTTLPKELDIDTFLKSLENIENKENFIEHLQSKTDAQSRLAYLNLVEPTLRQPQMILEFANKKEYIKSFKDENGKNILNLIITKQDDTMLVTMIPNVKASYLKSEINKADIIRSFIPQGSNKERTTTADSTTNKVFNQGDIKFDSLGDFERFARLSGFENLPQEKLQSAHKYILENLHKLEC